MKMYGIFLNEDVWKKCTTQNIECIHSMFCVVHFFQTIRRLWWYVCIAICEFLIWQFHWMHLRSSLQYSIAALVYSDALFD